MRKTLLAAAAIAGLAGSAQAEEAVRYASAVILNMSIGEEEANG